MRTEKQGTEREKTPKYQVVDYYSESLFYIVRKSVIVHHIKVRNCHKNYMIGYEAAEAMPHILPAFLAIMI